MREFAENGHRSLAEPLQSRRDLGAKWTPDRRAGNVRPGLQGALCVELVVVFESRHLSDLLRWS
jgi:hypothetical protein